MRLGCKCLGQCLAMSGVIHALAALASAGSADSGTIYYDTFRIQNPLTAHVYADATVKSIHFTYDGGSDPQNSFSISAPSPIYDLGPGGNADGLIQAPNGNLLIGGSTTGTIVQITKAGTLVGSVNVSGTNPYHLSLSPDGNTIYSGGSTSLFQGGDTPGPLGVTPFFSNGAGHAVSGDDSGITQLAFLGKTVYYTSSPDTGNGSVGTFNLGTFTTTRHIASLPAAHGITFDPFTNDLIVSGAGHITQIDPNTFQVVSDLDLSGSGITMLDQLFVDGHGHLFAGDNGQVSLFTGKGTLGKLVFLDYSGGTHQVGAAANFVATRDLALGLDDITLPPPLTADINGDGKVDFSDLVLLAAHYGTTSGATLPTGDLNGDGKVDFADLVILASRYGQKASPAVVLVPEPGFAGWFVAGVVTFVACRRRTVVELP